MDRPSPPPVCQKSPNKGPVGRADAFCQAFRNTILPCTARADMLAFHMKSKLIFALTLLAAIAANAQLVVSNRNYSIILNPTSNVATVNYSNRFFEGICTVDNREGRKWVPIKNFFTTQRVATVSITLPTNNYSSLRLRCIDATAGNPFVNLAHAYGSLATVGGGAPRPEGEATWLPEWEGGNATDVYLSDPCCAVADADGNIYVAERTGHAVDKISPDGIIRTILGTRVAGDNGDAEVFATNSQVHTPSGLFIAGNRLFVLESGNNRIRDMDLNTGLIKPGFPDNSGTAMGTNASGLWIAFNNEGTPNEAFYGADTELRHFEKGETIRLATGFGHVADVVVNPNGRIIVADSKNNRVYRVRNQGHWGVDTVVAGTGFPHGNTVGGDADEVALAGPSSIVYLPVGGFLIGLDEGARVWYVDNDDNAGPFIFGKPGVHQGDGEFFRKGGRKPKIGNVKSVSVAPNGDIIMVEGGYVRKVIFLRRR
jgi:hypothetical protein